jgi:hypothetical protein
MSTQTETASTPHVDVDQQVLDENFAKHDIPLRHNLASNPLFELEAIADLADRMPEGQVEHNLGNLPEELPDGAPPQADLSPGEIARGIETNGCWLVLKRIEFDPRYKALLESLLGPIAESMGPREGGATKLEAYIVLSAPNSTTPVHIDPEHNFFMHIRGPKRFDVGSWDNEESKLTAMKRYYGEEHRYVDKMPPGANSYNLEPGDGLYLPPHAPHMVKTFDPVAISLSCAMYTKGLQDLVSLYRMNSQLEKIKVPVAPPGRHPSADRAKAMAWRGLRKAASPLRRS